MNYTAVFQTYNEEERIELALLPFLNRAHLLVVDNESNDNTRAIAEKCGAKVVTIKNNGYLTRDGLKSIIDLSPTDWILIVFCSHHFPNELIEIGEQAMSSGNYDAIAVDGTTVQYGSQTNAYGVNKKRVIKSTRWINKRFIDLDNYMIHTEIMYSGNSERMFYPPIEAKFLIYNYRDDDISSMSRKASNYAYDEARTRLSRGEKPSIRKLLSVPVIEFLKRLFWRKCIFEGWKGITISITLSFARFCVEACMFELAYGCTSKEMRQKNIDARKDLLSKSSI